VSRALDVVTYNLMGLDEARLDERTEAICQSLLLTDPPDVVLLQEVVARTLHAHVLPHFAAAGFTVAPRAPVSDSHYFCVVAVRGGLTPRSAWRRPFPGSSMGRALLCLDVDWEGVPLRVCTAHLESLKGGAEERVVQARAVMEAFGEHDGPALFGGDTNLRGDRVEALEGVAVDAWEIAGAPAKARGTWWPLSGRGPRMRFDRLWLGGQGTWSVDRLRTGPDLRVQGQRASDHIPLRAALRWR
jgi:endonuclease/exonuclease/phosphatase family metal-dependent hydrolase